MLRDWCCWHQLHNNRSNSKTPQLWHYYDLNLTNSTTAIKQPWVITRHITEQTALDSSVFRLAILHQEVLLQIIMVWLVLPWRESGWGLVLAGTQPQHRGSHIRFHTYFLNCPMSLPTPQFSYCMALSVHKEEFTFIRLKLSSDRLWPG